MELILFIHQHSKRFANLVVLTKSGLFKVFYNSFLMSHFRVLYNVIILFLRVPGSHTRIMTGEALH